MASLTAAAPANQHKPAQRVDRRRRLWLVSGWGLMAVSLCSRPRAMLARRSAELAAHCRATVGAPQKRTPRGPGHCGTRTCACTHRPIDRKPAARHPARSTRRVRKRHWRSGGAATGTRACRRQGRPGLCPSFCGTGVTSAQSWRSWQMCPPACRRSPPPSRAGALGRRHSPTYTPWRTGAQQVVRCTVGVARWHTGRRVAGLRVAAGRGKEQSSESRPS